MVDTSVFDRYITKKVVAQKEEAQIPTKGSYHLNGDNICPYCKKEMRTVKVQDMVAYLCDNDRAVVPAENELQADGQFDPPQEVSFLDVHRIEQMAYRRNLSK